MVLLYHDLWDYDEPAGTEAAFIGLLGEVTDAGDLDAELQLLTQIARAQALQRRFDEASATLQNVEARLPDGAGTARIRWLLERGRTMNSSGEPGSATPFVEAWELASSMGNDGLAVDAAHMAAIVDAPPGTEAWHTRALELAENSDDADATRWRGSLANNMGWAAHDAGDHERALDLFSKGVSYREAEEDDESIRVARWAVARAKRSLGRFDEALVEQFGLRDAIAAAGAIEDGYVEEEIAELLLVMGRPYDAAPYFVIAARLLAEDPWLVEAEPERIERLRLLGG